MTYTSNNSIYIVKAGWIFVGKTEDVNKENYYLVDAKIVRYWKNGKGIGGLAKKKNKKEYVLDEVGEMCIPKKSTLAIIKTEW